MQTHKVRIFFTSPFLQLRLRNTVLLRTLLIPNPRPPFGAKMRLEINNCQAERSSRWTPGLLFWPSSFRSVVVVDFSSPIHASLYPMACWEFWPELETFPKPPGGLITLGGKKCPGVSGERWKMSPGWQARFRGGSIGAGDCSISVTPCEARRGCGLWTQFDFGPN